MSVTSCYLWLFGENNFRYIYIYIYIFFGFKQSVPLVLNAWQHKGITGVLLTKKYIKFLSII